MQRPRPLLISPLLLCAALAACSSGGDPGQAAGVATDSSDTSSADASSAGPSSADPSGPSGPPTSTAATSATAPPAPAAGSVITFTGKVAGRMTATACAGGIAQLEVDIDGQSTSFAGIIDAHDFTFVGPNASGYTLAKGVAAPRVSGAGTTFTVHATKLIGILNDDTVTATGSVTCP